MVISGGSIANKSASGAKQYGYGGGIAVAGDALTIDKATIAGNSATGLQGGSGGAVRMLQGTATLSACSIASNSAHLGGGVGADGGALTIDKSTIARNSTVERGGIYGDQNGRPACPSPWRRWGGSTTGGRARIDSGGTDAPRHSPATRADGHGWWVDEPRPTG